jgi:hypothetical protein
VRAARLLAEDERMTTSVPSDAERVYLGNLNDRIEVAEQNVRVARAELVACMGRVENRLATLRVDVTGYRSHEVVVGTDDIDLDKYAERLKRAGETCLTLQVLAQIYRRAHAAPKST